MSKIFEALKKSEGEVSGISLPLIDGAGNATPQDESALSEAAPASPPETAIAPIGDAAAEEIPQAEGIRVVTIRPTAAAPILPFDGSHPGASEQYRILRTRLSQHPAQPRMIVVSSASPGEGKTTSSINIAGALALKNDVSVLLVDGDLRRSSIAGLLGIDMSPGVAEVVSGGVPLEQAIVRTSQIPNLYVLPAGRSQRNPAEVLDSPHWKSLCLDLRANFQYVIVDAPPVSGVADYDLIQASCDGVIMVIRPDLTNRKAYKHALRTIPRELFLGVVVNCVKEWFLWKNSDYSNYYYSERPK